MGEVKRKASKISPLFLLYIAKMRHPPLLTIYIIYNIDIYNCVGTHSLDSDNLITRFRGGRLKKGEKRYDRARNERQAR